MQYIINNNGPLNGEIVASGAKNSALGLIVSTILTDETVVLENIPNITDVQNLLTIMDLLGSEYTFINNTLTINNKNINPEIVVDYNLVSKMRASYYIIGAFLGKFGEATVALPGGCNLGTRPMDLHFKGFESLGASINLENGNVIAKATSLTGSFIFLDTPSVGATINIMLAAVLANGKTIIKNAAKEPHIVDIAILLNKMGAKITGAGTSTITIKGVDKLYGTIHKAIPDQIEIGTYMIATAMTRGDILIKNTINSHLNCISFKLKEMGANIEYIGEDMLHISCHNQLNCIDIETLPYPGFPTDLQPQISTALGIAKGNSLVEESIFNNRFIYVGELARMGANMKVYKNLNIITGINNYKGAIVHATDLRGGAALVLAGLVADKKTTIKNIELIQRGYENFDEKLHSLGANIIIK